ncbi:phage tail tape measure protein [Solimicrobium silvestre]|nr:phage tail tape measure protein [Solimicrobium silvestre]
MSEVIGSGVIQVSADSSKLKAGIDDAKKSIASLGDANEKSSARSSRSIDNYVKRLQTQNATLGKSTREVELYKLQLKGATAQQLKAADSALKMAKSQRKSAQNMQSLKTGFIAVAAAATAAAYAVYALTGRMIEQITVYQGISEKIGDTAVSVSSLKLASDLSGVALDRVAAASVKLTSALSKTDDESKLTGAAIKALGLDFQTFKSLSPVEQIDAIAKAMAGFKNGAEKTAVAVALFGQTGAEMMPFLNDLADKGQRHTELTEQQIASTDNFNKSIIILKNNFSNLSQKLVANAIPVLSSLHSVFVDLSEDETVMAVASDHLNGALEIGIVLFQTLAVVGSEVGYVFLSVGREIGAIAAQLVALAHGDISGFKAISNAVKEDAERARKELDKFQQKIMSIGVMPEKNEKTSKPVKESPKLDTSGLVIKTNTGESGQLAKAQLDADLRNIRQSTDALISTYANAEKIMQARRAAGLVADRDYYLSKLSFINLNKEAQEKSLQAEIARLQTEKFIGKEKIENDKKIADAQAKLLKSREDAVTNIQINSIAEAAAIDKTRRAYDDATFSANNYLAAIDRQNQRDISKIGRGVDFGLQADITNKIDDKKIEATQRLDRDKTKGLITAEEYQQHLAIVEDTYAKEIALAQNKNIAIKELEGDWINGAKSALENYADQSSNVASLTENLFTKGMDGMTDSIVDFAMTGKSTFGDFAKSMIADIAKMMIKMLAMKAIKATMGMFADGGAFDGGKQAFAKGGAFDSGVTKFASGGAFTNSIVDQPTNFNMGQMGEAGPEAIMPLTRMSGGELGVRAQGVGNSVSSSIQVNVYVQQDGNSQVDAPSGMQQFGKELADFVDARIGKSTRDAQRPGGSLYNLKHGTG